MRRPEHRDVCDDGVTDAIQKRQSATIRETPYGNVSDEPRRDVELIRKSRAVNPDEIEGRANKGEKCLLSLDRRHADSRPRSRAPVTRIRKHVKRSEWNGMVARLRARERHNQFRGVRMKPAAGLAREYFARD